MFLAPSGFYLGKLKLGHADKKSGKIKIQKRTSMFHAI